jgi:glycosyltransferase involved in cell wall biosynthesis
MKSLGISHVHVHFGTNPTAVAQIMRAMGGPPYSFTVHGPDEFDAPIGLSLGSKIADAVFVVAENNFCAGQLRRWADHAHWKKIRVVRNTVGEEFFSMARPVDPTSKTLVAVGRLSAQKAQLLLIEGFAMAIARGVDANLVLAGDGEMRGEVEDLIRSHGLEGRVRITGWITGEQVREEILASRVMVLPSFAEGLPLVIMEAFALGRTVLVTHIAGIPELVVNGESGWLIPSGTASPIADGIEKVMAADVETLEKMARIGCEAVRERHYTPTETARLAEIMRETDASNAVNI